LGRRGKSRQLIPIDIVPRRRRRVNANNTGRRKRAAAWCAAQAAPTGIDDNAPGTSLVVEAQRGPRIAAQSISAARLITSDAKAFR
jgi:hypothetical protein